MLLFIFFFLFLVSFSRISFYCFTLVHFLRTHARTQTHVIKWLVKFTGWLAVSSWVNTHLHTFVYADIYVAELPHMNEKIRKKKAKGKQQKNEAIQEAHRASRAQMKKNPN